MIGHFFTTSHTERLRPFGGGRDAGVQHGDGLEHVADHHLDPRHGRPGNRARESGNQEALRIQRKIRPGLSAPVTPWRQAPNAAPRSIMIVAAAWANTSSPRSAGQDRMLPRTPDQTMSKPVYAVTAVSAALAVVVRRYGTAPG